MALTATANTQTEADIVRNLKLKHPFITRSSFNRYVVNLHYYGVSPGAKQPCRETGRPNLTYDVRKKTSKFNSELADYVRNHIDDSGIIYWYTSDFLLSCVTCYFTAANFVSSCSLH
jgi:bloom syndrome protein